MRVFHMLSGGKSPQVSRTLLSILVVLNNVVVWMDITRPPNSKSSNPFSNPLVTVQTHQLQLVKLSSACRIFFQFPSKAEYYYFYY